MPEGREKCVCDYKVCCKIFEIFQFRRTVYEHSAFRDLRIFFRLQEYFLRLFFFLHISIYRWIIYCSVLIRDSVELMATFACIDLDAGARLYHPTNRTLNSVDTIPLNHFQTLLCWRPPAFKSNCVWVGIESVLGFCFIRRFIVCIQKTRFTEVRRWSWDLRQKKKKNTRTYT